VLQLHGYRLSEDLDVFNAPDIDVSATAELDIADLKAAGFEVSRRRDTRASLKPSLRSRAPARPRSSGFNTAAIISISPSRIRNLGGGCISPIWR
jgi:hypothetical protein